MVGSGAFSKLTAFFQSVESEVVLTNRVAAVGNYTEGLTEGRIGSILLFHGLGRHASIKHSRIHDIPLYSDLSGL